MCIRDRGNGAQDAACIVMDVHSGEVLAMASYPTFDLNDTRNPEALIGSKLIDVSGNSTDTVINEADSYTHLDVYKRQLPRNARKSTKAEIKRRQRERA